MPQPPPVRLDLFQLRKVLEAWDKFERELHKMNTTQHRIAAALEELVAQGKERNGVSGQEPTAARRICEPQ